MSENKNENKIEAKSKLGPRIYIESLMNDEEWRQRYKDYPATSTVKDKPQYFKSDFDWRYKMGASLTPSEIKSHNINLEGLKSFLIQKDKLTSITK